ncbi:DinB superfamily protein [Sphingobacterium nematocida]|uniref:DinB superfamily protein n=1 Tax=Sphingobacterium nematocida TaxID=1513896 RepID=A0A1T5F5T4_9SPHI|nr:putative metal-dependent hydrolase [Sphingobacterium nematocida]SKB91523.1 DinB superfamily protein [Sphingobacterium nematocida]
MEIYIESLKYPIGQFQKPGYITKEQLREWTKTIQCFPNKLNEEIKDLTEADLQKQYRINGWTIRQIINHCADSHMNSLIRFKLALTEETPAIKPYLENLWAELPDSKDCSIESSLKILTGLHERWVYLLENLSEAQLEKVFLHPENNERISLKTNVGIYAWHCEHHLAHIKLAKQN